MPAVPLPDPLWWVARRLRQFLTALAMLVLAFGAGTALTAAAADPASSANRPVTTASSVEVDPVLDPVLGAEVGAEVGAAFAIEAASAFAAEPTKTGSATGIAAVPVAVPHESLALGSAGRTSHPDGAAGGALAGPRAPPHS